MPQYNDILGRADLTDVQLPDQISNEIIQEAPQASLVMNQARKVAMTSKKYKQSVLAGLPKAYFVDGDNGLKQTTDFSFKQVDMTAEEIAAIVPIPDSLVDDSNIPLWNQVKPLLTEAIGALVDEATLIGTSKPTTWPDALIPGAKTAKQTVENAGDLGVAIAKLGESMAANGVAPTGFLGRPGLNWNLVGLRDTTGQPIYTPGNPAANTPANLYGYQLVESRNGVWNAQDAELLAVDWNKVFIGIRQDVTFDLFSEGVISDANGKVILNLMQQDTKALRVVFRVGYQVMSPVARQTGKTPYPAGIITPAAAPKG